MIDRKALTLCFLAGMILLGAGALTAHALPRCNQDFCTDVPLRDPQSPAPATTDNLPATYDFPFSVFCSDRGHGDTTCDQWTELPPNVINNYQIISADLTLTQTYIDSGFWLEAPTMRVDLCTASAPGADRINCATPWFTWMGVPGTFNSPQNPFRYVFRPDPSFLTLADARALWVHVWVNNADIHADLTVHARRVHVDTFDFSADRRQVCWSATNALSGVTITLPGGITFGTTARTCAPTSGPGDYTLSASGPGPGLNGSPPATVKVTQSLTGAIPTNHFGCGTNNTCELLNGPPPDTDGCSANNVGQACGGGGGDKQCNPPKWSGFALDGCWDVNGTADCSRSQDIANAWCQNVCGGTSAKTYDRAWGQSGTTYYPTGRTCSDCSFGFTNLVCNTTSGGGFDCVGGFCKATPNGPYGSSCDNRCPTNPPGKYSCVNNACVSDPNGNYNSSNCGGVCGPKQLKYACENNACIASSTGPFDSTSTCAASGCGGGGGDKQCNPPKWSGFALDGCWDVNGTADCSRSQDIANAWCQNVCGGTSAKTYDRAWGQSGTTYYPTGRTCSGCSFGFTNLVCNTSPPTKYSCVNNACVQDPNGNYNSSDCGGVCGPKQLKYACENNACVEDPNGTYTSTSCNGDCTTAVQHYSCQGASGCKPDDNGPFTSATCDNSCATGPTTHYACSGQSCIVSSNGPYTTSACGSGCPDGKGGHADCTADGACIVSTGPGPVSCHDYGNPDASDCIQPPPTCSISLDPSTVVIPPPRTVTMTWTSQHANTITISPQVGDCPGTTSETSGSCTFSPDSSINFTMTCAGRGGTANGTGDNGGQPRVRVFMFQGGSLKEIPPDQ